MADIQRLMGVVVGVVLLMLIRDFGFSNNHQVHADDKPRDAEQVAKRQRDIPKPNFGTMGTGPVLKFAFWYAFLLIFVFFALH